MNWFDRMTHKLLFYKNVRGCDVYFWTKKKNYGEGVPFSNSDFMELAKHAAAQAKVSGDLKNIDIIISYDLIQQMIAVASGVSEEGAVELKDIELGKNRIMVRAENIGRSVSGVMRGKLKAKLELQGMSSRKSYDEAKARVKKWKTAVKRGTITQIKRIISHEIAHIWNLSVSTSHQLLKKRNDVLDAVESDFKKKVEKAIRQGKVNELNGKYKLNMISYYFLLKTLFMHFKDLLCTEGFAVFMEQISTGNPRPIDIYRTAEYKAKILNQAFDYALKAFEGYTKHKMFSPDSEKNKFDFTDIIVFFQEIKKDAYVIGPAIPSMLYYAGRINLEDIARMMPSTMMKKYEELCVERNVPPIVSSRTSLKAMINLREIELALNAIRKKAGI